MLIRTFPNIQRFLTAISTSDVFEPMTPWFHTLEVSSQIQGVLAVRAMTGTWRARLGLQTAATSLNVQTNPTSLAAYPSYFTSGTNFFRFDPNGASDGNIDASAYFRFGVFHNFTGSAGQGDIELQGLCWR